jgi:hypothetical protein
MKAVNVRARAILAVATRKGAVIGRNVSILLSPHLPPGIFRAMIRARIMFFTYNRRLEL